MTARMREQGVDHVWLDVTGLDGFDSRFPTIAAVGAGHRPRPGDATGCPLRPPPTTSAAAS